MDKNIFPWTPKPIEGSNILEKLRKKSKPNCNKCSGRGFTGWRDVKTINKRTGEKLIVKQYVPCKCLFKKRGKQ